MSTKVSRSSTGMNVLERGSGRPILFVHGWPTNANIWKHQLEGLSSEHCVLAVDLPGFGESAPIEQPTMKAFASAVRDFIDERGFTDVFLIGWSMGAGVVMCYNEYFDGHGLRAIGIVDDCPKLFPDEGWLFDRDTTFSREAVAEWRRLWESGDRRSVIAELTSIEFKDPKTHSADIEWMIEESMKADPGGAIAALLDVMELDFRESLRRVEVPTLLLYGEFSRMTTPANREFMQNTIPNSELVVFHESAHNPMIEEPEKFNSEVDAFATST